MILVIKMVDVETDYLKPEFLYLLLFERCSVIIKPFLLPSKLEYLTILLDVFFRIDRYDTENADLFFEEENLDLLMENYASQKANIDILGEEKPPLLFFPQIVPEMHNALKKHPETPFLGVQSMNCDSTGIANEYERIAVFNKKRGAFEATKPKGIINSSQRNESLFEWCNNVAEMLKQKPEGNEVFEYLLGIQSASKELYFLIGGTFDEVAFYTLLKDFIKQERAVIVSLTESLYNLDLSSLLGNYEHLFQNVKDKIEHAPSEVKEITERRNEDVEDYRSLDEWFFRIRILC